MKLRGFEIRGFQQFQHTVLDFTNPATGEAVDKVCFIGRNGTGKSTLLRRLHLLLRRRSPLSQSSDLGHFPAVLEFESEGDRYYLLITLGQHLQLYRASIDQSESWRDDYFEDFTETFGRGKYQEYQVTDTSEWECLGLADGRADLLVYCPPEVGQNQAMSVHDVPNTNVGNALSLSKRFPFSHTISQMTVKNMWTVLLHLTLKREQDRQDFESRAENLDRTKRELIDEFEREHPEPLAELAQLWNKILAPADLEFDFSNAHIPVQVNDNLKVYIRHKSTGETIKYNELSTGIRDFLFRIGHLFLLYFNRRVERGFVLVDEPENSLFPDFLFTLMEVYDDIVRNDDGTTGTQIFMATHNPIVAAQFEPFERIILEWDGHGHVTAMKGSAPVGDDPNDVLERDFKLTHLMGKEGEKMWEQYLDLRKRARRSSDPDEQQELAREASDIASRYRFGADEP